MKLPTAICITALIFVACESKLIAPEKLVGVWWPTYQMQTKESNGKWGPWTTINTLVALPNMEFTIEGRFLRDGKDGADCCTAGNKYAVSENIITFSETKSCPQVSCANCNDWKIVNLNDDTLILEVCSSRSKYVRGK